MSPLAVLSFAAGLFAWAGALAGCTPSPTSGPVGPDALAVCPSTIDATSGQPCQVEGMLCAPEYPCGILQAIATCTCTAGLFSCKDVAGRQLNPGDSPTCPPGRDAGVCPSTEPVNHAACRESGLVCAYPNSCGNHVYDECQCFPAPPQDGGVDLRFECTSPCFESDAALMGDDGSADADAAGGFDAADVGSIADARDGPSD